MSDTPITDAAIVERRHIHRRDGSVEVLELVDANISRALERNRECYKNDIKFVTAERDALRDAINVLHDYVQGKRHDDKDISEIINGAMRLAAN